VIKVFGVDSKEAWVGTTNGGRVTVGHSKKELSRQKFVSIKRLSVRLKSSKSLEVFFKTCKI